MGSVNPWSYSPSGAAALIFLILFVITTGWHSYIMVRSKAWYFVVLVIGGLFEVVGYLFRYLATTDNTNLIFFIVQTLTILVAPALLAATIYMVLGRLIMVVRADSYSPINPRWLTKIFVLGDLVTFLVQVGGSSFLTSNFSMAKTIIMVGLAAQLVFFGLFVVVAILVWRRLARVPTEQAERMDETSTKGGWRGVMRAVFLTSALIFIRSVFRLIEFTGDSDSVLQKSEAYIYVCDSTLMFLVMAILIYYHPSEYVPTKKEIQKMREVGEELL